jgi:hypothetical protein
LSNAATYSPLLLNSSLGLPGSALAAVFVVGLGLPTGNDTAVRGAIGRVVLPQCEGLARLALVALADAFGGLDEQTITDLGHFRIVATGGFDGTEGNAACARSIVSHESHYRTPFHEIYC